MWMWIIIWEPASSNWPLNDFEELCWDVLFLCFFSYGWNPLNLGYIGYPIVGTFLQSNERLLQHESRNQSNHGRKPFSWAGLFTLLPWMSQIICWSYEPCLPQRRRMVQLKRKPLWRIHSQIVGQGHLVFSQTCIFDTIVAMKAYRILEGKLLGSFFIEMLNGNRAGWRSSEKTQSGEPWGPRLDLSLLCHGSREPPWKWVECEIFRFKHWHAVVNANSCSRNEGEACFFWWCYPSERELSDEVALAPWHDDLGSWFLGMLPTYVVFGTWDLRYTAKKKSEYLAFCIRVTRSRLFS